MAWLGFLSSDQTLLQDVVCLVLGTWALVFNACPTKVFDEGAPWRRDRSRVPSLSLDLLDSKPLKAVTDLKSGQRPVIGPGNGRVLPKGLSSP